jgi:hypothetical protein
MTASGNPGSSHSTFGAERVQSLAQTAANLSHQLGQTLQALEAEVKCGTTGLTGSVGTVPVGAECASGARRVRSGAGTSTSSVRQTGGSAGNMAWEVRALEGRFHLRYIISGFLLKQKENSELFLTESGAFPPQVGWWDLFLVGIAAEGEQANSLRRGVDGIPAGMPSDWSNEDKKFHEKIVERLMKTRREKNLSMVALAQAADPHHHLIPWRRLEGPSQEQGDELEPPAHMPLDQGQAVWLYGPISCVRCDCTVSECKWKVERDAMASGEFPGYFKVAAAYSWCVRGACECDAGCVAVKIRDDNGVVECSWTTPVGVPGAVPGAVPLPSPLEAQSAYNWPSDLIDRRHELKPKPVKKVGKKPGTRWSAEQREAFERKRAEREASKDGANKPQGTSKSGRPIKATKRS